MGLGERSGRAYRVLAVDFDGTLTTDPPPTAETLQALADVRSRGMQVALVTGRILSELRRVFPGADEHFDAIVAENGAVLVHGGVTIPLGRPISHQLAEVIGGRGLRMLRGDVLLACASDDEAIILEEARRLGEEVSLIRNRGELMVMPPGINKRTGLLTALSALRRSPHDTVAVGDAENDHTMLAAVELGVAVANAVPALRDRADLVLTAPAGQGIVELCTSGRLDDRQLTPTTRWQVTLGTLDTSIDTGADTGVDTGADTGAEGSAARPPTEVTLPASGIDLLIAGASGVGKSFIAGLITEQLITMRYSVLVIDPEGDHVGLEKLPDVTVVGGSHYLPTPQSIVALLRHGHGAVIVDLSHLDEDAQGRYLAGVPAEIEAHRRLTGLPHWLVLDEAQRTTGRQAHGGADYDLNAKGHCLVTWRVDRLASNLLEEMDTVLALTSPDPPDAVTNTVAAITGDDPQRIGALLTRPTGQIVVGHRQGSAPGHDNHPAHQGTMLVTPRARATPHQRHEHKYATRGVDDAHAFWFRVPQNGASDAFNGAGAHTVNELREEVARCHAEVLVHHTNHHDFSRWVDEVFRDAHLACQLFDIETLYRERIERGEDRHAVDDLRTSLIETMRQRGGRTHN